MAHGAILKEGLGKVVKGRGIAMTLKAKEAEDGTV